MASPADKVLTCHVGRQIGACRREAGYTQQQLADLLGKSLRYTGDIEAGKVGLTLTTLRDVCLALHVSADTLLFGDSVVPGDTGFFLEQLSHLSPAYLPPLQEAMSAHIRFIQGVHGLESDQRNK